ncbi:glycosyltransferase [uncultured Bacteroides sp.]|uniref:glycosyltransferase n=1 Tax=uncultured Bacteroides sp. TaxID=162156 RepID=UPI002637734B|nr:glycosyltransferase [uncultured Bacteroides sp.]
MKVLIIGNRNHQFIYNYVKAFRRAYSQPYLKIDVLSQDSSEVTFSSDKYFDDIYALTVPPFLRKIRFLRILYQHILFRKYIRMLNHYDIIHVHYIENIIVRDIDFFSRRIHGKLIVSIWGSDFLRASKSRKKKLIKLFNRADRITIASDTVIKKFKECYIGNTFISKIVLCRLGLEPLENLRSILMSDMNSRISKSKIGLCEDKIIITIGYNASRLQHHIDIIENIEHSSLLSPFCDKIEFLLPITYPKDNEYITMIKKIVLNSKYHYNIIEHFLSDGDVAHLRIASDIFVQLQPTDMLSGSMLEHLSARNIVITGSWLPYDCLDQWGIFLRRIDRLELISNELYDVLNNFVVYKELCDENSKMIIDKFRWNNVIQNWISLYKNEV